MAKFYNLVRVNTTTVGAGPLILSDAVSGFLTFDKGGVQNGETVSYAISDGPNSEIGVGVYSAAGPTLTRTVTKSTNNDALINLSGDAQVFITPRAEDFFVSGARSAAVDYKGYYEWAQATPDRAPFRAQVSGDYDTVNPHLYIGYNLDPTTHKLIKQGETAFIFGIETNYFDSGAGHYTMEAYWQYQWADNWTDGSGNANYNRPIMVQWDKVTHIPRVMYLSSGMPGGFVFGLNDGTGANQQEQVAGKTKATLYDNSFTLLTKPGAIYPAFIVDSAPANAATGLTVSCFAAGDGVRLGTSSSATNESMWLDAKGNASLILNSYGGGQVLHPDGSAAKPSMSFNSGSGTGFYLTAANAMSIALAGARFVDFSPIQIRTYQTTGITYSTSSPNATGSFILGPDGSGGALWINTPSLSAGFASGLGVTGSYASAKSTINLNAYGVASAGGYTAEFAFSTSTDGVLSEIARIKPTGIFSVKDIGWRPSASITPAANGDLVVQATSNTSLTFKLRGTDGTVRSASLTLA